MKIKLGMSIFFTLIAVALIVQYFQNDKIEVTPLTANENIYIGEWEKNTEKGIHIKKAIIDNKSMLIVHYNRNLGKNLYFTTEINAKIEKNKLKIYIVNKNAIDDLNVTSSLSVKIPYDDDWTNIEVYEDGVIQKENSIAYSFPFM